VNPKRSQVDRLEDGSWMPDVSGVENRMRRILIIRIRLKGWMLDAGCRRFLLSKYPQRCYFINNNHFIH